MKNTKLNTIIILAASICSWQTQAQSSHSSHAASAQSGQAHHSRGIVSRTFRKMKRSTQAKETTMKRLGDIRYDHAHRSKTLIRNLYMPSFNSVKKIARLHTYIARLKKAQPQIKSVSRRKLLEWRMQNAAHGIKLIQLHQKAWNYRPLKNSLYRLGLNAATVIRRVGFASSFLTSAMVLFPSSKQIIPDVLEAPAMIISTAFLAGVGAILIQDIRLESKLRKIEVKRHRQNRKANL